MEPIENIKLVCKECSDKTTNRYIEFSDNYFLNKHVKLRFTDSNTQQTESCWVLVEEVMNGIFTGILANDPILDIGVLCGDSLTFEKPDIRDVFESAPITNV